MAPNRKRGRNLKEDEVEFMPLSKRINNLHINNNLLFDNANMSHSAAATASSSSINGVEWGPGPPPSSYSQFPESPPASEGSLDFNSLPQYTPDLNENQNPHYFNINKLLFEMYVERLQRSSS